MAPSVLRLIQFEPKLESQIFKALSDRADTITYVKPGQYIITKEECDYLRTLGIHYEMLADLDPRTLDVLKWYKNKTN